MKVVHILCDLCKMDGYIKPAVASYRDGVGDEWDVCPKHLEIVKEAGLKYWMLALKEEVDEV